MHYGNKAFGEDPNDFTIESELDINEPLGGKEITKYDLAKIQKMYNCQKTNGISSSGIL